MIHTEFISQTSSYGFTRKKPTQLRQIGFFVGSFQGKNSKPL